MSCRSKHTGARGPDGDAVEGSGFSSRMAFFDTLSKWMRVHKFTLMLMANTAVSIYGINELLEFRSRLLLPTLRRELETRTHTPRGKGPVRRSTAAQNVLGVGRHTRTSG